MINAKLVNLNQPSTSECSSNFISCVIFHFSEKGQCVLFQGLLELESFCHVNGYCKDQQKDSELLNASCVLSTLKGASLNRAAFSVSNHTNLIRVICPWSCSGCWAAVRPLFSFFALEKGSDVHKQSLNRPLLFFTFNLIYHNSLSFSHYKLWGAAALVSSELKHSSV